MQNSNDSLAINLVGAEPVLSELRRVCEFIAPDCIISDLDGICSVWMDGFATIVLAATTGAFLVFILASTVARDFFFSRADVVLDEFDLSLPKARSDGFLRCA